MAASGNAVLTGAIINIVTALIAFLVFSFLRLWKKAHPFYDSKRHTPAVPVKPHQQSVDRLGWILPTFLYKEPDIIHQAGLDTAIYLRLLKYGVVFFGGITLWTILVVLPTNWTDDETVSLTNKPDSEFKFSNFDKASLANVQPGSHRMWVHVVSSYLITLFALKLLWQYSKDSVLLRIQFLGNSVPGGPTHTVLVTDVPAVMDATNKGAKERKQLEKQASAKKEAGSSQDGTGTVSPEQVIMMESEGAAVVSAVKPAPAAAEVRQRKVFNYDLATTSLDPLALAQKKLAAGSAPEDLVSDEFNLVYGDQVKSVEMVHDQSELTKLVAEYDQRKSDLEDYLDAVRDKSSRGEALPVAKVLLLFPDQWCKDKYGKGMFKKVDGLPFWKDRLTYLEGRILEEQEKARQLVWPSAFVTFKNRVAQSVSATGLHHHDETTWRVRPAPEPRELLWYNLGMDVKKRSTATSLMWVLFWLMTFFYMIPVAALQALIDVPKLAKTPGLKAFLTNVVVQKLLEAIVPGLVLKIFLALVPLILAVMMKKSGAVSESEVDFGVVTRFFIFQVVVVFVGATIGGSFFSQVNSWISDPGSVFSILGTAIPQAATFFITYIWVQMATTAIGMLRVVGLILMWVFSWLAGSPRARERVYMEQYTSYGTSVTSHTMVLLLGTVFSCINPIVTPSALAYFCVASISEKYNNIYVYRRRYESGGQLWSKLLNQIMTGLYIFQICMIGLISIKKFPYSVLIIPVLPITVLFHMIVLRLFRRPWSLMSLHDAAELDINDKVAAAESMEAGATPANYISPVFKVEKGALGDLLAQIDTVSPVVAADAAKRAEEAAAAKANKKGCF